MVKAGRKEGLRVAEEAYVDRTYDDTGAMTSRKFPDAMIHDPEQAVKQVMSFIEEGAVISKSGKKFPTRIHTFCCHGDEATGVAVVTAVRAALEKRDSRRSVARAELLALLRLTWPPMRCRQGRRDSRRSQGGGGREAPGAYPR